MITSTEVLSLNKSKSQALIINYTSSKEVFKESKELKPQPFGKYKYYPWGYDNQMPWHILEKIEEDETASQCLLFNSEMCYSGGLRYITDKASEATKKDVKKFQRSNKLSEYFLGICTDLKYWGWCVTVIILSKDGKSITNVLRKEAMYCRKVEMDKYGNIPYILYGNWRNGTPKEEEVERITVLDRHDPLGDLRRRMKPVAGSKSNKPASTDRKFAIITEFPTVDHTYYPIPYYGSLLKSKWYDIKQLIAFAKFAKLKNGASLKYIVTIAEEFWDDYYREKGVAGDLKQEQEAANKFRQQIIDYLSGAENAGKTIFTGTYIDPGTQKVMPLVNITTVDQGKEGGDWESDFAEAVNMVCFAMGVHSNLVGSVPGKSQSNNSGSDKRELYTIAQTRQKSSHDILLPVHEVIFDYNGWNNVEADIPVLQLTTLDEHKDKKESTTEPQD